jgi:hypothetical protein
MEEMCAIERMSRKLARRLFFAMVMNGPSLEKRQVLLGRFVDVGAELFVQAATVAFAQSKTISAELNAREVEHTLLLVRYAGQLSRIKIGELFRGIAHNPDADASKLAKQLMEDDSAL